MLDGKITYVGLISRTYVIFPSNISKGLTGLSARSWTKIKKCKLLKIKWQETILITCLL